MANHGLEKRVHNLKWTDSFYKDVERFYKKGKYPQNYSEYRLANFHDLFDDNTKFDVRPINGEAYLYYRDRQVIPESEINSTLINSIAILELQALSMPYML